MATTSTDPGRRWGLCQCGVGLGLCTDERGDGLALALGCPTASSPRSPAGKRGPEPQKGDRQRGLKVWAARGDTPWQEEAIGWYGGQKKTMPLFSRTALWYRTGQPPLPIRFVMVRDPEGKLREEVFFATDLQAKVPQ